MTSSDIQNKGSNHGKGQLANLQLFVTEFLQEQFYIGIEVHKRSYHIDLRRSDGRNLTLVSPASLRAVATP